MLSWDYVSIHTAIQKGILACYFMVSVIQPITLLFGLITYFMRKINYVNYIIGALCFPFLIWGIWATSFYENKFIGFLQEMGIMELDFNKLLGGFTPIRVMLCAGFIMIVNLFLLRFLESSDVAIKKQELKEQEKQIIKVKKLPFSDSKEHVMNIGTTGSGKTLYELCEHILPAIQKGEPLIIVSGKNGSDDSYSLLNQTKRICAKYKRGLTIVSLDPREKSRKSYNPFRNFKKIQMVDALNSMTEFSEAHYESAFRNWSMTILELMERANRPFSLPRFLQYYRWEDFVNNLKIIEKNCNLSREEVEYYLGAEDYAKIAADSYSRLKELCSKDSVISDSKKAISIRQELLKRNVVFFDLDAFSYTKYTRQIGALIIADIRSCIATLKIPQNARCKVCLDELGYFCDKSVSVLYTQARAKNYQIIASIQDTTNLDSVQAGFSEVLLANANILALGRLAGEDAGNVAEKYIGTYSSVDTTRKSEGAGLDGGETGSKRSVNKFRITPERLRNLPDKTVIYINKAKDRKLYEAVMDVNLLPPVPQKKSKSVS